MSHPFWIKNEPEDRLAKRLFVKNDAVSFPRKGRPAGGPCWRAVRTVVKYQKKRAIIAKTTVPAQQEYDFDLQNSAFWFIITAVSSNLTTSKTDTILR